MSNDFNDDVRVDFDWDYIAPLSIYERGLVITAMAALNGEGLGKMCPGKDFSQYVDEGRVLQ